MKPFGGKPQQLTLFKAPKPTAEHRWPEGYTPERMHAVAGRVEVIQRGVGRVGASNRYTDTTGGDVWSGKLSRGQKNVVADIARSSVPTEDIHSPYHPHHRLQVHARSDMMGGGLYLGGGSHGKIAVGADTGPNTLLHEMGHAHSDMTNQSHSTVRFDEQVEQHKTLAGQHRKAAELRGVEEAYADNYAQKHVGRRRGESPQHERVSVYERGPEIWHEAYGLGAHSETAYRAYMSHRQFAQVPEARSAPAQMPHGAPPMRRGQYWQPSLDQ